VPEPPDFSGDVRLEDLMKVFQAHGVDVRLVDVEDERGKITECLRLHKGDLIDVFRADPVIYKGKAHWLARAFEVPLPELYQPDKFTSAKK
jgi:hypothetical protein